MVYTKLVNHAAWNETGEVAFYHAGAGSPPILEPDRWQPVPGAGAILRVCCTDSQLRKFNALNPGDVLVLHQRVAGRSQVVTHVLEPLNNGQATPTSPWEGWPWERPFVVLARLRPQRFSAGVVGRHGDLVSDANILMRHGEPRRLRHLLGWNADPGVQSGAVFSHHGGQAVTGDDLRREITVANGFERVVDFDQRM